MAGARFDIAYIQAKQQLGDLFGFSSAPRAVSTSVATSGHTEL
jgi:hypothetical protein